MMTKVIFRDPHIAGRDRWETNERAKASRRVDFVGYVIRPHCKYVRRSTIDNMYKRTQQQPDFESLRATVNSYFGMLRNANAYKERKRAAQHLSKSGCWFDGQLTKLVRVGAPQCTFA